MARFTCPSCQTPIILPAEPTEFGCPTCEAAYELYQQESKLRVRRQPQKQGITCPLCKAGKLEQQDEQRYRCSSCDEAFSAYLRDDGRMFLRRASPVVASQPEKRWSTRRLLCIAVPILLVAAVGLGLLFPKDAPVEQAPAVPLAAAHTIETATPTEMAEVPAPTATNLPRPTKTPKSVQPTATLDNSTLALAVEAPPVTFMALGNKEQSFSDMQAIQARYEKTCPILTEYDELRDDTPDAQWCASISGFLNSQHQSPEYPKWTALSYQIYQYGFRGIDKESFVHGSKSLDAEYTFASPEHAAPYHLPYDYMTILAAVVPPDQSLLPWPNFAPYQVENSGAKQSLNIKTIFGEQWNDSNKTGHQPNLCGPLAVLAVTEDEVEPYFKRIDKTAAGPDDLLTNPDRGTDYKHIMEYFSMQGWEVLPSNFDVRSCQELYGTPDKTPYNDREIAYCQLRRWMDDGTAVVTGANLLLKYSVVVPARYKANRDLKTADHWIAILQVIDSLDKETYVRIYNSYQNREEIYLWQDFFRIWYENRGYGVNILAQPKQK